jgi:DNA mismatch repair protein MutS
VIDRAREILTALEHDELSRGGRPSLSGTPGDPQRQLGLFHTPAADPLREKLAAIDIDRLTPLEALQTLADLKEHAAE